MSKCNLDFDSDFFDSLRRQDEKAFCRLFHGFSGMVYSITVGLLGDKYAAEDALQEVFVKVFHALPRFQGNKIAPWLGKIAHNHCLDCLRKVGRTDLEILMEPEKLDLMMEITDSSCELPDFLNSLTLLEREVVILKKVDGLSYKEIADITGRTEGTLRNLVLKVLHFLKGEA
ncbi:MAG: sigma-70 family RNA polymerase sigma factor [Candidatus Riflebacteria bacterium]